MAPKGKWAAGITPRNFSWVIKERLALCERPGGYGSNHRRVRRQEEIIWIREQGFTCVLSLLPSPHNLHNYEELGVNCLHRPFSPGESSREVLAALYPELAHMLADGGRVVVHRNELGDPVVGLMAGYLAWSRLVPNGPRAISIIEQITHRQLGPVGRNLVGVALELRGANGASVDAAPS
ncbi:MAG: hypothetical protein GEV08_08415 [Acidimicrobiia bacterium]|nr:hypothetical protein [Acidimicrobiia bacterium]